MGERFGRSQLAGRMSRGNMVRVARVGGEEDLSSTKAGDMHEIASGLGTGDIKQIGEDKRRTEVEVAGG